jgi:transposase
MTAKPQPYQHIIAFEIAKHGLTLHILPADIQETIANTPAAVRRVLRREERRNHKHSLGAILIVCEATGGYERHVLAAAVALSIPLHRAHGIRTRHFARYLGLAKTDPIDARIWRSLAAIRPICASTARLRRRRGPCASCASAATRSRR